MQEQFVTQQQRASVEPWLPLIAAVIREFNSAVRSERAIEDETKSRQAEAAEYLDKEHLSDAERLDALILGETSHLSFWNEYKKDERTEVAALFAQLQKRGSLSKAVIKEQLEAVHGGMTYKVGLSKDNRVEPQMVFDKDPFLAREAKVGLALLALAAQDENGYRLMQCPHAGCGVLFLQSPKGKGPKSEACKLHVNAYRIARHRAKHAAKHK